MAVPEEHEPVASKRAWQHRVLDAIYALAGDWKVWVAVTHLAYMLGAYKWHIALRLPILFALVFGILSRYWLTQWRFWGGVTLYYLAHIIYDPYWLANHHYVLFYTALAMTLSTLRSDDVQEARVIFRHNARAMMVILMGAATLQKLLSPSYRDGSFYAYLISHGGFGRPLWAWHDKVSTTMSLNRHRLWMWFDQPPGQPLRVDWPYGDLQLWGSMLSWATIGVEAAMALLALFLPKGRVWAIGSLLFVWSLVLIRQELMFISLVTLIAALMLDESRPNVRRWQLVLCWSWVVFIILPFILKPLGVWSG